jgi:ADP-ribose pyrophosphatase
MGMDKFEELEKKEIFKNEHIKVFSRKLKLPNNRVVDWTFTGRKDAVGIVAVFEDDTTLLVRQYRPAVKIETLEIPAGLLERDESPVEAALRELEEETGYRAEKIEKICEYFMSPGVSAGRFYLYYAENLVKTQQHLDEDEFVEVDRVSLRDIAMSDLSDGKSIIAVEYAKKKRGII